MLKTEMIKRSPLRILEKSTHGGLGKGNIGVIAAPMGLGKTACLVHIATDQLFQDKHIIHVSFAKNPEHIRSWYEDIFNEMAQRYKLDGTDELHNSIIRNRIIMNFRQDAMAIAHVEKSIRSVAENAQFNVDTLVVDGYDFSKGNIGDIREFRRFALELGLEVWFSASVNGSGGPMAVPSEIARFIDEIAILISLEAKGEHTRLHLLKDHDAHAVQDIHLELDPHILLISRQF
jgi:thymidine kinase